MKKTIVGLVRVHRKTFSLSVPWYALQQTKYVYIIHFKDLVGRKIEKYFEKYSFSFFTWGILSKKCFGKYPSFWETFSFGRIVITEKVIEIPEGWNKRIDCTINWWDFPTMSWNLSAFYLIFSHFDNMTLERWFAR